MTRILALMLAMLSPEPRVTGVSITPVADRTEVVILVDGSVTARDFMIPDGRLVIDLSGVPQSPRIDLRDINRGGVRELRVAPYQPNVVRVVLQLHDAVAYNLTREDGRIRVSFANERGAFEPWSHDVAGGAAAAAPVAAAPARTMEVAPRQEPTPPRQQSQERPIRVTFENQPVTSVLNLFSELSGRTIIPSAAVRDRTITAEIRDLPWDVALEAILQANGLAIREGAGGVLLVEDAAALAQTAQAAEPQEMRAFTIEFVSADSIRGAVAALLEPNGTVTVNSATSTLLVQGPRSAVQRVAELLPMLDVKTPQVDLSARIAFVDRTTLEAMGVIYDLKDSRGNQLNSFREGLFDDDGDGELDQTGEDVILLGGNSIAGLGNAQYRVASPSLQLISSLVLGRHSLIAFLEALQTVNMSQTDAKPYLRVLNHRQANIQVGQQTPIRTIDAGATGGGAAPMATVDFRDTGIILRATPHIVGNQIRLELHAENSTAGLASSDVGVVFNTQNAQTEVIVDDGETVVIAGLTITTKTKARTGIPLLMDLPVIGALFRNESEEERKQDLLIMITPKIVRD